MENTKIYRYIDVQLEKHNITVEEAHQTISFLSGNESVAYRAYLQKYLNEELEQLVAVGGEEQRGAVRAIERVMQIPVVLRNFLTHEECKKT
jgi:hypothetical protein